MIMFSNHQSLLVSAIADSISLNFCTLLNKNNIQGTTAAELLSSQERGALVKHVLEAARAEPGDEHALEPALTLRPGQSIGKSCFMIYGFCIL